MVFSEIIFLLYFLPLFLVLYFLVPGVRLKNLTLLLASIFFYSWGAPQFVVIALLSCIANFYLVKFIDASPNELKRRLLLIGSLVLNLGILSYFKYANFFIENVNNALIGMGVESYGWTNIALPIGISFFTFQSLSYTIDIYRKSVRPLKRLSDYVLYIMMFPQMIAGPIVRFASVSEQIIERSSTVDDKLIGFFRFCLGLAKKVLIANVLGANADAILGGSIEQTMSLDFSELPTSTAWLGLLAYTFQIYFDFSGYSDMAIGLGRMFGFRFPENFNSPYISQSITEFWKRWHITLGAWMRDYVYIALGGNRVGSKLRLYTNLWIVFLLSGLWHGAAWGFIIWGAYHGLFLVLDRLFLKSVLNKIGKLPSVLFTFLIVSLGWVIFKIENLEQALIYYQKLFSFSDGISYFWNANVEFYAFLILAIFISFASLTKIGSTFNLRLLSIEGKSLKPIVLFLVCSVLLVLSTASIASGSFNPFIYFRF